MDQKSPYQWAIYRCPACGKEYLKQRHVEECTEGDCRGRLEFVAVVAYEGSKQHGSAVNVERRG
jgi:hypothetical protein